RARAAREQHADEAALLSDERAGDVRREIERRGQRVYLVAARLVVGEAALSDERERHAIVGRERERREALWPALVLEARPRRGPELALPRLVEQHHAPIEAELGDSEGRERRDDLPELSVRGEALAEVEQPSLHRPLLSERREAP